MVLAQLVGIFGTTTGSQSAVGSGVPHGPIKPRLNPATQGVDVVRGTVQVLARPTGRERVLRRQSLEGERIDGFHNGFLPLVGGYFQIERSFRVRWTLATLRATGTKGYPRGGRGIEKGAPQNGMRFAIGKVLVQKFLQLRVRENLEMRDSNGTFHKNTKHFEQNTM